MKTKYHLYNRRELFKIFGGSAVLLYPILSDREVLAQGNMKKRLLIFHTPNGVYQDVFWPKGTPASYKLEGTSLEPLKGLIKDVSIIKGVSNDSPGVDAHMGGMIHLLTGNKVESDYKTSTKPGKSASIDMMYAKALGDATKIRNLNLSVMPFGDKTGRYLSYDEQGRRQNTSSNPYAVYSSFFASRVGCGGPDVFSPDETTTFKRKSMLDALKEDLKSASAKTGLGAEERQKLDAFAQSIRDIEMSLEETAKDDAGICTTLSGVKVDKNKQLGSNSDNLPAHSKLMHDLIVVAFQLDLTRVITLSYSIAGQHGPTYRHLMVGGKPMASAHHQITHQTRDPNDWREKLAAIDKWHIGEYAKLIGRLNAVKEGSSTLLKNSLALYASEIGEGMNHGTKNTPFIVAGTGGGVFKTGQLIDMGGDGKTSHHGLLLDLLEGVGVKKNQIGRSETNPTRILKKA